MITVDIHAIQTINMFLSLIGLVICIDITMLYRKRWRYFVPPFIWFLLVTIFYNLVFLRDFLGMFAGLDYIALSAYLRLFGLALMIGFLIGLRKQKIYLSS